jgi:hypothetical protein
MSAAANAEVLIWLHADCLSAKNPAFQEYPGAHALFVLDEAEIEDEAWSLKRVQFLYECALEIPCEIRRGDVAGEVMARARELGVAKIVTVDSVNPRFAAQRKALERFFVVEVLAAEPFVDYRGHLDLKRFSRYWKRVEPVVFHS